MNIRTALFAASVACATAMYPQAALFSSVSVNTGAGPGQVVLADLNRDGHLDMVTRHLMQRKISVLLGDGKGGFAPAPGSPINLTDEPGGLAAVDVTGDGIPDLVVTRSKEDKVDIFAGDGRGGFKAAPGSPFTASASPDYYTHGVHVVDINEDGKPDIVTSDGRQNTISILFGDGRGHFASGPSTKFDAVDNRSSIAFGDVDGDGHIDVVEAANSPSGKGRLAIWLGNGKGAFKRAAAPLATPAGPLFVLLADMNGDQRLDVVMTHHGGTFSVLLNNGKGSFAPAPSSPYSLGATDSYGIAAVDLNRDHKMDLVAATVDSVMALIADGTQFTATRGPSPYRAGPGAYSLSVGDINGDGHPDVAVSSFEGSAVTLLLARGR